MSFTRKAVIDQAAADQAMIEKLCLFAAKIGCSTKRALNDGYFIHTSSWNIVHKELYAGSTNYIWHIHNPVLILPAGHGTRRLHPLSYMLVNRITTTVNRNADIDRIMCFPSQTMDYGFDRAWRATGSSSYIRDYLEQAIQRDREYKTNAYSLSFNLGAYCVNLLFGHKNEYTLPDVLKSAMYTALDRLPLPRRGG